MLATLLILSTQCLNLVLMPHDAKGVNIWILDLNLFGYEKHLHILCLSWLQGCAAEAYQGFWLWEKEAILLENEKEMGER